MSGKSKQSSKAKSVDRPFASEILSKARQLVEQYQVILRFEDSDWYGRGLELSHVFGDGKTPEDCVNSTREALIGAVAYMLEQDQRPPTPAREGTRTEQVNVRLTAEEKVILETTARRKGFQGLSDFVRAAALDAANK
jgi:predicted RNase H-like HicB family nuclease